MQATEDEPKLRGSGQKSPKKCRSLQFQEFRRVRTNLQPETLRRYMLYEGCRGLENKWETDLESGVNLQALRARQRKAQGPPELPGAAGARESQERPEGD